MRAHCSGTLADHVEATMIALIFSFFAAGKRREFAVGMRRAGLLQV